MVKMNFSIYIIWSRLHGLSYLVSVIIAYMLYHMVHVIWSISYGRKPSLLKTAQKLLSRVLRLFTILVFTKFQKKCCPNGRLRSRALRSRLNLYILYL